MSNILLLTMILHLQIEIESVGTARGLHKSVHEAPATSKRRHSLHLGIKGRSLQCILKLDLHMHLYKTELVQQLSP